jgi:hypothetical protein
MDGKVVVGYMRKWWQLSRKLIGDRASESFAAILGEGQAALRNLTDTLKRPVLS